LFSSPRLSSHPALSLFTLLLPNTFQAAFRWHHLG
jgi:hypothetical protein